MAIDWNARSDGEAHQRIMVPVAPLWEMIDIETKSTFPTLSGRTWEEDRDGRSFKHLALWVTSTHQHAPGAIFPVLNLAWDHGPFVRREVPRICTAMCAPHPRQWVKENYHNIWKEIQRGRGKLYGGEPVLLRLIASSKGFRSHVKSLLEEVLSHLDTSIRQGETESEVIEKYWRLDVWEPTDEDLKEWVEAPISTSIADLAPVTSSKASSSTGILTDLVSTGTGTVTSIVNSLWSECYRVSSWADGSGRSRRTGPRWQMSGQSPPDLPSSAVSYAAASDINV